MSYNPSLYMPQPMPAAQPNWYYQPTQTQPVNGVVGVTGIEGARAYQMPPNSKMPLFDNDSDILYVKSTDAGGYPTIKAFSFAPLETDAPKAEYVTREDFDELAAQVRELMHPAASKTTTARARKAATDGE